MQDEAHSIRIDPSGPLRGSIALPSSKYLTLRYVLAAILAEGTSTVFYPAFNDDTAVLLSACVQLGATIQTQEQSDGRHILSIQGTGGKLKIPTDGVLDVGNAGAVLRLLLGICALAPGTMTFTTPYPASLGRRPNADLLQALTQLGVTVESPTAAGTLPITIQGGHLHGGEVTLSGAKSSQYISSLLFLAPLLPDGLDITIVDGLASASFIDLTVRVLTGAGIQVVTKERHRHYVVPGKQHYQAQEYLIPGDYPSAAALIAGVAVAKGDITLHSLQANDPNGEVILDAFSAIGVQITRSGDSIVARSQEPLRGIIFDGNTAIDSVPVIVAAACFASSPSRIYNVANLRLKESDRINDLAAELNALGCHVVPSADAFEIHPVGSEVIYGGVTVDAHADHRLVEALAIAGLGSKHPVTIANAQHVAKSYPHFFEDLAHLGAKVTKDGRRI